MYYDINVSLNGKHFFATAKRSVTCEPQLRRVILVFIQKFPANEGYNISVSLYREAGEFVDIKKVLKSTKVYIKFDSEIYSIYKKKGDLDPIGTFSEYDTLERYCSQNGYVITKIHGL